MAALAKQSIMHSVMWAQPALRQMRTAVVAHDGKHQHCMRQSAGRAPPAPPEPVGVHGALGQAGRAAGVEQSDERILQRAVLAGDEHRRGRHGLAALYYVAQHQQPAAFRQALLYLVNHIK